MNSARSGLALGMLAVLSMLAVTPAPAEAGKGRRGDTTPPTVTCPEDITAEASSSLGAWVLFSASATDDKDPSPTISYSRASGSQFRLGTTTVHVTATDSSGNSDKCTFQVTVQDTTAPYCPSDTTVEATGPGGAVVTYYVWDLADPSPTVVFSHEPGSTFPIGTTTVTVTATDASGNSTTCSFDVTVRDSTPPLLWGLGDIVTRATGLDGATVSWSSPSTWDRLDPAPSLTYSHASGDTFPVGTTTVTVTATDDSGNAATGAFDVTVLPYDDDPTDSPFAGSYEWLWWTEGAYAPWYTWDITIAGDGTVTGSGMQQYMLVTVYYGFGNVMWYYDIEGMPDAVSATGSLDGFVSDDGTTQVDGENEEYYDDYWLYSNAFSLSGQASLDADGNLLVTDSSGAVTVWYRR